jgi:hypothetical protein
VRTSITTKPNTYVSLPSVGWDTRSPLAFRSCHVVRSKMCRCECTNREGTYELLGSGPPLGDLAVTRKGHLILGVDTVSNDGRYAKIEQFWCSLHSFPYCKCTNNRGDNVCSRIGQYVFVSENRRQLRSTLVDSCRLTAITMMNLSMKLETGDGPADRMV